MVEKGDKKREPPRKPEKNQKQTSLLVSFPGFEARLDLRCRYFFRRLHHKMIKTHPARPGNAHSVILLPGQKHGRVEVILAGNRDVQEFLDVQISANVSRGQGVALMAQVGIIVPLCRLKKGFG